MKTFLLLFLFITSLFATDLESSYTEVNQEIDKLAPQLNIQEEVTLYYLVMSTHTKMLTHTPYSAIKESTLKTISNLHKKKSNISSQEIEHLRTLYITLIHTKLKHQKEKIVSKGTLTSIVLTAITSLLFGLILGFVLFKKKKNSYSQQSDKSIQIINELENKNKDLTKQIMNMQKAPKNGIEEKEIEADLRTLLERKDIALTEQNIELQTALTKLESEYNELSKEQMTKIQHLNEYVISLKNELAKHESSSTKM